MSLISPSGSPLGTGKTISTKPGIDLSIAIDILCECGNKLFMPLMRFKKIPAVASPTGQDAIVPAQVFACSSCGTVPEFLDID